MSKSFYLIAGGDSSDSGGQYTDSSIRVLEGLEAVRERPGMYIGSTDSKGLHHLIWEVLDNSVDEVLAGFANEIKLTLKKGHVISVSDNGRGIPTGINPQTNISNLITVFTVLHAGGKFDNNSYKTSGGLHGVGSTCVNALSSFLEVNVYRNGEEHYVSFENGGKIKDEPKMVSKCEEDKTGTVVTWKPDFTIFEKADYDANLIESRLTKLAYLNKGKKFVFVNEITKEEKEFFYEEGIKDWVINLNADRKSIHDVIFIHSEGKVKNRRAPEILNSISITCAFQYTFEDSSIVHSFCNNIDTASGGTHLESVKDGLLSCIRERAIEAKIIKEAIELTKSDVLAGLTAIVSLNYSSPEYSGQTKEVLSNIEIKPFIKGEVELIFGRFLEENPEQRKVILQRVDQERNFRLKLEMARQADRKLALEGFMSFAGKLADCTTKSIEFSELYVVEGDSAGGSAKSARNREYQAILPIKGKLINVWKRSKYTAILENEEVKSLISAVGCSYGQTFDISKLKYNKLIIMTDADVDGSHIRILLLTCIYKFMKPLLEHGYVYIAQPPLYRAFTNKEVVYLFDDKKKDEFLKNLSNPKSWEISRFKGLGEMSPEQLWQTTMNPEERTISQVTIKDAEAAKVTFDDLMGKKVQPRTEFIFENYANAKNLDI
ncbi:DNA gyrase subunit B [Candidatus Mycoplasma haematobovis]|uniref:DNA topoisomerase (ATP-hydrolyzing) n=1 Tax=Candidatus Mycoplasma haematobovis TaxID=432608 RepID=A0A1A9QDI4_9MOLU|nr:DNA gyrase subunit B [Candidatus Mycoplasma haematobovis]OAL10308.1 DNA gyrase subunit B [Candidatus Mycoplasma haematobovis]